VTTYIKNGIMYERHGKCLACGKCCNGLNYSLSLNIIIEIKKIDSPCNSLIDKKCNIHHNKNRLCRKFPLMKEETDLFPECGYYWVEKKKTNRKNSIIYMRQTEKTIYYHKIKGEKYSAKT